VWCCAYLTVINNALGRLSFLRHCFVCTIGMAYTTDRRYYIPKNQPRSERHAGRPSTNDVWPSDASRGFIAGHFSCVVKNSLTRTALSIEGVFDILRDILATTAALHPLRWPTHRQDSRPHSISKHPQKNRSAKYRVSPV